MELTSNNTPEDFVKNNQPVVSRFDEFVSKWLSFLLKTFFFFVPLTIGLHKHYILLKSPLMKLSALIFGYCTSIISWLFAWLIPRFVFGVKYDFVREVYNLYLNDDFTIAISLVFLLSLFSRFIVRTLDITVTSYVYRKYIFIITSIITLVSCVLSIEYIYSLDNPYTYLFGFSVTGIIYFILMMQKKNVRKKRIKQHISNIPDDIQNHSIGLFK